ncbi:MAG: hypothetical protein AAFX78_11005 [Cyanobacteria bacterium J06638_20]
MTASNQEDKDTRYSNYLKERELYIKGYVEAQKDRDKTLVTLYSTSFGFSLTLVKFIGFSSQCVWPLAVSWILLGCSLISILLSMIASTNAWLAEVNSIDQSYQCDETISTSSETNGQETPELQNDKRFLASLTDFFNYSSYVLFIIGLLMLLIFAINDLFTYS